MSASQASELMESHGGRMDSSVRFFEKFDPLFQQLEAKSAELSFQTALIAIAQIADQAKREVMGVMMTQPVFRNAKILEMDRRMIQFFNAIPNFSREFRHICDFFSREVADLYFLLFAQIGFAATLLVLTGCPQAQALIYLEPQRETLSLLDIFLKEKCYIVLLPYVQYILLQSRGDWQTLELSAQQMSLTMKNLEEFRALIAQDRAKATKNLSDLLRCGHQLEELYQMIERSSISIFIIGLRQSENFFVHLEQAIIQPGLLDQLIEIAKPFDPREIFLNVGAPGGCLISQEGGQDFDIMVANYAEKIARAPGSFRVVKILAFLLNWFLVSENPALTPFRVKPLSDYRFVYQFATEFLALMDPALSESYRLGALFFQIEQSAMRASLFAGLQTRYAALPLVHWSIAIDCVRYNLSLMLKKHGISTPHTTVDHEGYKALFEGVTPARRGLTEIGSPYIYRAYYHVLFEELLSQRCNHEAILMEFILGFVAQNRRLSAFKMISMGIEKHPDQAAAQRIIVRIFASGCSAIQAPQALKNEMLAHLIPSYARGRFPVALLQIIAWGRGISLCQGEDAYQPHSILLFLLNSLLYLRAPQLACAAIAVEPKCLNGVLDTSSMLEMIYQRILSHSFSDANETEKFLNQEWRSKARIKKKGGGKDERQEVNVMSLLLDLFHSYRNDPKASSEDLFATMNLFCFYYERLNSIETLVGYLSEAVEGPYQFKFLEFMIFFMESFDPLIERSAPKAVQKKGGRPAQAHFKMQENFLEAMLQQVRVEGLTFSPALVKVPESIKSYRHAQSFAILLLYLSELTKRSAAQKEKLKVENINLLYLLIIRYLQGVYTYFPSSTLCKSIKNILHKNNEFKDLLEGINSPLKLDLSKVLSQNPETLAGINLEDLLRDLSAFDKPSAAAKKKSRKKGSEVKQAKKRDEDPSPPSEPSPAPPQEERGKFVDEKDASAAEDAQAEGSQSEVASEMLPVLPLPVPMSSPLPEGLESALVTNNTTSELVEPAEKVFNPLQAVDEIFKNCERFLRRVASIQLLADASLTSVIGQAYGQVKALKDKAQELLAVTHNQSDFLNTTPKVDDPLLKFKKELASLNWDLSRLANQMMQVEEIDAATKHFAELVLSNLASPKGLSTLFPRALATYFLAEEASLIRRLYEALEASGFQFFLKGSRVLFPECESYDWDGVIFSEMKIQNVQFNFESILKRIDPNVSIKMNGFLQVRDTHPMINYEIKFSKLDHPLDITFYTGVIAAQAVMEQLSKSWLSVCSAYYHPLTECQYVQPEVARTLFRGQKVKFSASNELELSTGRGVLGLLQQEDCAGLIMRMRVKFRLLSLDLSPLVQEFERLLGDPRQWGEVERPLIYRAVHYFMIHFWKAPVVVGIQYLKETGVLTGLFPDLTEKQIQTCLDYFFSVYQEPSKSLARRYKVHIAMAVLFSKLLDEKLANRELVMNGLGRFCEDIFWRVTPAGIKRVDKLFIQLLEIFKSCPSTQADFEEKKSDRTLPADVSICLLEWSQCLKFAENGVVEESPLRATATVFLNAAIKPSSPLPVTCLVQSEYA